MICLRNISGLEKTYFDFMAEKGALWDKSAWQGLKDCKPDATDRGEYKQTAMQKSIPTHAK